jgi:hypothetical protein
MINPPRWSRAEMQLEADAAKKLFRDERLLEPLERWKTTVDEYRAVYTQLFRAYRLHDPAQLAPAQVAELFKTGLGDALRYMTGPPISRADLEVLAECTLAPARLAKNPEEAARVLEIIAKALDPARFPWISQKRSPTPAEESTAILASAVLITSQRASTDRRSEGKSAQEAAVKKKLVEMGFIEIRTRPIQTLSDAPNAGEFCGEALVGSRKADIPVRLFDGRLMPIECKVSNSSTNSVKRLNNDAAVKAAIWQREFGTNQIVPAAMLSGVFKVINLEQAQSGGLTLFWAHRLDLMKVFIEQTKTGSAR